MDAGIDANKSNDVCTYLDCIKSKLLLIEPLNVDAIAETFKIEHFIRTALEDVAKHAAATNKYLAFEPILRGSGRENTRTFFPDEFDYILHCTGLQKHISLIHFPYEKHQFLIARDANNTRKNKHLAKFFHAKFDHGAVAMPQRLKTAVFTKELYSCFECLSDVPFVDGDLRLVLVQPKHKQIGCLKFRWTGDVFKDMMISVDLVPSFKFEENFVIAKTEKDYREDGVELWTFSTCSFEQQSIGQLPKHIRDGFILAKALRIAKTFPQEIIEELSLETDHIDDYLTSYMLKQLVLYCREQAQTYHEPAQIAHLLYSYIEMRLRCHGSILTYFHEEDAVFECTQTMNTPPDEWQPCCFKRRLLLRMVQWILRLLRVYCTARGLACAVYSRRSSHMQRT